MMSLLFASVIPTIWPRSTSTLATRAANEKMAILTSEQTSSLHIASVTAASLSIVAGAFTLWWFFRMRRTFRHDLIMWLIGCDIFKACWFFLFPAVELAHGPIHSDSNFCQASGFFLTLSIITSDLVITFISIHTALYIFRGQQGLYPFRKYAYAISLVYPVVMSSLAFINTPGYINTGQFCYLPMDPMWARLVLSWVPRYFTFVTILTISIIIYIYVKLLMKRFVEVSDAEDEVLSFEIAPVPSTPLRTVPPTPLIATHGLISSPSSRRTSRDERGRQFSASTMSTFRLDPPPKKHQYSKLKRRSYQSNMSRLSEMEIDPAWEQYHKNDGSEQDLRSTVVAEEFAMPAEPTEAHIPEAQNTSTLPNTAEPLLRPADSSWTLWNQPIPEPFGVRSRTPSLPNMLSVLGRGPDSPSSSRSDTAILKPAISNTNGLIKTRETVRRQVKHVFIYPVVYIAVWILPFTVHLTGYGKGAPFGMRMASVFLLCLHGFIDAIIIFWKEKPWMHTRRLGDGLNFLCWTKGGQNDGMDTNAGRTKEEMIMDGRLARQRREKELEDRQNKGQSPRKGGADWWDQDV